MVFPASQFRAAVQQASARALALGALLPIATQATTIEEDGVTFAVRILGNLARKEAASKPDASAAPSRNPFLPYDEALYIADITSTHVALLNKYNVVDDHVLIVTRAFEPQESWLTPSDFEAWLRCLDEYPSLGFYNSGRVAGASQPHRHMQLVPLPLGPQTLPFPLAPRWQAAVPATQGLYRAELPFRHALARLPAAGQAAARAAQVEQLYRELLASLELGGRSAARPKPHNLLITQEWLFAVPRRQECFEQISLNAMAFAGALLVRDEEQLQQLKAVGPFAALCAAAGVGTS